MENKVKRILSIALIALFSFSILFGQEKLAIDYPELNVKVLGHLNSLANQRKTGRIIAGSIILGLGSLISIGGISMIATSPGGPNGDPMRMVGYVITGLGLGGAAVSIPIYKMISPEERAYRRIASMPNSTAKELDAQRTNGEGTLAIGAKLARDGRIFASYSNIGAGLGFMTISIFIPGYIWYGVPVVAYGLAGLTILKSSPENEFLKYISEKNAIINK